MDYAAFKAVCPFQIGDKVKVKYGASKTIYTILDIRVIHYIVSGRVIFECLISQDSNNPIKRWINDQDLQMEREVGK